VFQGENKQFQVEARRRLTPHAPSHFTGIEFTGLRGILWRYFDAIRPKIKFGFIIVTSY
jgi:hypothetical protein